MLQIGDAVRLRDEARAQERLTDLVGIEGRVGDAWTGEHGECCTVVYERRGCILAEMPSRLFTAVADPATEPF